MKTLTVIGIITLFLVTSVIYFKSSLQNYETEALEVYTNYDILYIRNLTVTSETGEIQETFKTRKELIEFIENITAKHVNHETN